MKQTRDYYFDNAKFLLIFFVVFGHFIQSFNSDSNSIYSLYKVIYTFHMPAFILVSGFFAKGIYEEGYVQKYVKKLILPYIIFQVIYSIFYFYLYGKSSLTVDPLSPHWSLWFLISLFFWNMLLLGFSKLKPIYGLSIAMFFGLAIGFVDWTSSYLSLTRTFVFFPLFLLGYYMNKKHFEWVRAKPFKIGAILIFVSCFAVFYNFPDINHQWLLGSKPYDVLASSSFEAILVRLGFYLLSFLMIFCFFACVPQKQYFFTRFGKNTLYVYLLHGFFIRIFRSTDLQEAFTTPKSYFLIVLMAFLLTLVLSTNLVASLAQPFIEFRTTKMQKWSTKTSYKEKLF
ncbi:MULTISPECIES: acyltransferase family protein [Bacillaceae]|uniref:acyltransferase family protein n=1 Tax=Bacillaceae TaxID=186817 RepID=UPI001E4440C3|nr:MULTISPECIES: acyltransferase family protein [Bacillaceae]MCE4048500.1 acyltransferase family protein [Bacillus sp. Au-Bac7]MDL0434940.1 acyltransferase family protein [Niallia sp. SS-2023]UPO88749.1 acyltransferase family protein [Niallia sp. Man26]